MTLRTESCRWTYSGGNGTDPQGDPDLSLGGMSPGVASVASSEPYRQANLDGTSAVVTQVEDAQTDTPSSTDPAVDDWLIVLNGAAAGGYGRVVDVDYGTGVITCDRPLGGISVSGNDIRTSRAENVFPNVTADQAVDGIEDYRMIYFRKTNSGGEDNFRFGVEPIQANGCDLEIFASGQNSSVASTGSIGSIANGEENPFDARGHLNDSGSGWNEAQKLDIYYGTARNPPIGSEAYSSTNDVSPIWIKRTVPPGVTGGTCVFQLFCEVPDALSQDATINVDPFFSGFLIVWDIAEPAYNVALTQDRIVYTRGGSRITATITDADGDPIPNLNAWLEIASGPGSIATDLDGRTDANGQVTSIYTAPDTITVDPVIRVVIPTTPGA